MILRLRLRGWGGYLLRCVIFRLGQWDCVVEHDLLLVRLHVDNGDVVADDVHLTLGQVGQCRRGCKTYLNGLIHLGENQVLGLNPPHR